jgi:two-component system nitrogen regulation sensor histidine kinase NtrY
VGVKKNLTHADINYLNSYQYITDKNQNPIAIISIPYFQLNESYKKDLKVYLLALIPVYLFLFFCANLLALVLSRQISGPMSRLSETMREAAIMKKFMPLSWNSKDEIGQLVRQYNFMVKELEKSADMLAQNEKENAWKEMAKQVAHEIKNPLTPMKLNVQLFERTLRAEKPLIKSKVKLFSDSIIEQIDTLSNIASAFSDFARMPMSKKENVDLSKIAENTINFFNTTNIVFEKPTKSCYIYADRGQVIRILNNLLNNAIESVPENKTPLITVNIKLINECVNLSIGDNGEGIPTALHKKIFNPSFTTKNSGMGLGLAIVKRIINDLNGSISFKSSEGRGTTFYISIPRLKEKTNFTN